MGRRVLDLAAGSGLVGIAASMAGAATVTANDIDPYAAAAAGLNARINGVGIDVRCENLLDGDGGDAEVVLAGDAFYNRAMAEAVMPFLRRAKARGARVLVGDPGRAGPAPRPGGDRRHLPGVDGHLLRGRRNRTGPRAPAVVS